MNKPEILSPAGSYEAFVAAVNNGCDAVYLGGAKFGARAFANNFDEDTLRQALAYAHLRQVKVYYTINTLMKQKELSSLVQTVAHLRQLGMDAFIVQDIGVLNLLANSFIGIELHVSTQANTHHASSAKALKAMGANRVVLARELNLEEIKVIKAEVDIEIEAFVHGALCYAYSGGCLMSSFIGGRSGNRGRCAQPCRHDYTLPSGKTHPLLSPKDIMTLKIIPDLLEAGIDSFKIEGRMKGPEYVGLMTYVYRHYLDQYKAQGHIKILDEDLEAVLQVFNRGGFSQGYYKTHNGPEMMTGQVAKHQGTRVGKLISISPNSLQFEVYKPLKEGDCLEFDLSFGKPYSFIVKEVGGKVLTVKGKFQVPRDVFLRRIMSIELNDSLKGKNQTAKSVPVDMVLTLTTGLPAKLDIFMQSHHVSVEGDIVQTAKNQGLEMERIKQQISKLGDGPFFARKVEVIKDGQVFMPISKINELRREAASRLEGLILNKTEYKDSLPLLESITNRATQDRNITVLLKNRQQFDIIVGYDISRIYLDLVNIRPEDLKEMKDCLKGSKVQVYGIVPKIWRHEKEDLLTKHIEEMVSYVDGFLIRSLEGYFATLKYGLPVVFDHDLGVMNQETVEVLKNLSGYVGYTPSLELNKNELSQIQLEGAEVPIFGKMRVMTSAQCVRKNTSGCVFQPGYILNMEDRKAMMIAAETVCLPCFNRLYNPVKLNLIDQIQIMNKMGIGDFRVELLDEASDETKQIMESIFFIDELSTRADQTYTRGHFNKGVE